MYDEEPKAKKPVKKSNKNKKRFIQKQSYKPEHKNTKSNFQKKKPQEEIKEIPEIKPEEVIEEVEKTEEIDKIFTELEEEETKPKKEKQKKKTDVRKWIGLKTDWVSILVKLALFLFIAFVVIFGITKIRQSFSKNTFAKNLEKIKNVAYVHYKAKNNRPTLEDEVITMTLKDMEEASLIQELKDNKNNVCSKDYSYVSISKKDNENYDLYIYLSCGGEAKSANYEISYPEDTSTEISTTLYELKRNVTKTSKYSCPAGYLASGRYCIKINQTSIKDAIPIYRITPEKNTKASYKPSNSEYEYTDPILVQNEENYICPAGYEKNGTKCIKYGTTKWQKKVDYTCPNGGTPSGTKCLFTTYTNYIDEQAYCKKGKPINGNECYITAEYQTKCLIGQKDTARNSCYTTYTPSKELSDWLFDGKVTYRASYTPKDTDTVYYEEDHEQSNGQIVYRKYIKKYIKVCDDTDELKGSLCRHYDKSYEQRYCSNSKYSLNSDQTECYTIEKMSYKSIKGKYTCPSGYKKSGSGENTTCYKYENATKNTTETPYCTSGYTLTSDQKCVLTKDATVKNTETYTCPSGYTKKGTGKNTVCYKKTTTDSYYYCSNSMATLENDRCIVPSQTTFVGYRCSNGYENSGSKCINTNYRETILATVNDTSSNEEEIIWSKSKDVAGWTWTGNTKEA